MDEPAIARANCRPMSDGRRSAGLRGRRAGGEHGRIREDELLELRVQEVRAELELLHFAESLFGGPSVVDHPIHGRHHTGAVAAADTMHVNRLVDGIGAPRVDIGIFTNFNPACSASDCSPSRVSSLVKLIRVLIPSLASES